MFVSLLKAGCITVRIFPAGLGVGVAGACVRGFGSLVGRITSPISGLRLASLYFGIASRSAILRVLHCFRLPRGSELGMVWGGVRGCEASCRGSLAPFRVLFLQSSVSIFLEMLFCVFVLAFSAAPAWLRNWHGLGWGAGVWDLLEWLSSPISGAISA